MDNFTNYKDNDFFVNKCEEIKPYLKDLLARCGQQLFRQNINCINPNHKDNNKDMSINREGTHLFCHCMKDGRGNGKGYDTLDAYVAIKLGVNDIEQLTPSQKMDALKDCCDLLGVTFNSEIIAPPAPKPKSTEDAKKAEKMKNYARQDIAKAKVAAPSSKAFSDYVIDRGFDTSLCLAYGLGYIKQHGLYYDKNKELIKADVITIPTGNEGCNYICTLVNRELVEQGISKTINKPAGEEPKLFNYENALQDKEIFICEGWADALSIIHAGVQAIALNSCVNVDMLLNALESDLSLLHGKTLYLCLDNGRAGIEATRSLERGLKQLHAKGLQEGINLSFTVCNVAGNYKDANESFINEREVFIDAVTRRLHRDNENSAKLEQEVIQQTEIVEEVPQIEPPKDELERIDRLTDEQLLNANMAKRLEDFMQGIVKKAQTHEIPTGFDELDKMLDGGLYEGLYVLIGGTGGGKTALAMQMSEQISSIGEPVLYIALEMTEQELSARAQSKHTFQYCEDNGLKAFDYGATARDITNYRRWKYYSQEKRNVIVQAGIRMFKDTSNLYVYDGMGNIGVEEIRAIMQKYKKLLGKAPVLIIDYLQILKPYDMRATDKANNDYNIVNLKHISRDFKAPVIVISSTQRDNYEKPLHTAAAKETGAIEYTSDVVFGLEFEGIDRDNEGSATDKQKSKKWIEEKTDATPRQMQLKIIKNRYGRINIKVYLDFYPRYSCLVETGTSLNEGLKRLNTDYMVSEVL